MKAVTFEPYLEKKVMEEVFHTLNLSQPIVHDDDEVTKVSRLLPMFNTETENIELIVHEFTPGWYKNLNFTNFSLLNIFLVAFFIHFYRKTMERIRFGIGIGKQRINFKKHLVGEYLLD